ncbi:MAG: hypothetical protein Kow00127_22440 [Bacteroidales bacterium]
MYSHFNFPVRATIWSWMLIMILAMYPLLLKAQSGEVTVVVQVYPPFSTHFSDYIDNPNKILVQLINNSAGSLDVYLKGSFTGDNGIEIATEEGYKPSSFITLQPGIPFQLTPSNLGDVFSSSHLVYTGITEGEIIQMQGLPEGSYQICLTVWDYYTDQQLSQDEPSGCSNPIFIQNVDPPQILFPICGDSITATTPQNLLFSWTIPVQTGTAVKYRFIMVEMFPGNRDPNDALASAVPPYFYEADLSINQLLYGPSAPQLIEGRSYAFVVQAYDPTNTIVFKNNGTSEACWFTWKPATQPGFTIDTGLTLPDFHLDDFIHDITFLPATHISGQLKYMLASQASLTGASAGQSYNQSKGSSQSTASYQELLNSGNQSGNLNFNNMSFGFSGTGGNNLTGGLQLTPPFGPGTINEAVVEPGNAEPLRNTSVRLVVRLGLSRADGLFDTQGGVSLNGSGGTINLNYFRFYDLEGNEIDVSKAMAMVGQVLDVTETDNAGNFSFDFQTNFFTGPFYAVGSTGNFTNLSPDFSGIISLKIEVINQKFCSPDIEIFAMPGHQLELPPQVALIKDYALNLQVLSEYDYYSGDTAAGTIRIGHDYYPKAIAGGEPIPNAIVMALRDMQQLGNEHPAVLLAEGDQSGNTFQNEDGTFKVVFSGKTDVNGNITIPGLVEHWAITDGDDLSPYFFYVGTRSPQTDTTGEEVINTYENTLYNFHPFFGYILGLRVSVEASGPGFLDDDAGWTGGAPVVYNSFYIPPQSANDGELYLMAARPEIKGRVMAATNLENIGMNNIEVNLFTQPDPGPDGWTILITGDDNPNMVNISHYDWERQQFTNEAGFFRFKGLRVDKGDYNGAKGPYRRFQINDPMYERITWPPLAEKAFNLKYGELFFKEFQLSPKYLLKARVADEAGNAVSAYVRLLPGNPWVKTEPSYAYDDNGNIYIESENLELPVKQSDNHIEIQPLSGQFFADTVIINQLPDDPNQRIVLTVFKKLHRLRLQVKNEETGGTINNASVLIGDSLAYGTTDDYGFVELSFPSPGQQFLVTVSAPDFTPTQLTFNLPAGKTWQNKVAELKPAYSIEGLITNKTTGEPIDSALVYTAIQSSDGHTVFLECYSDQAGHYILSGIPMTLTNLDIHATKDSKNPGYIGTVKNFTVNPFAYPKPSYDLQLNPVNFDVTNIWGIPVTIESLKAKTGLPVTISGYFHDLPGTGGIKTANDNEKVYFKNLVIENPVANGKIVPVDDQITLEKYILQISIDGGFQGKLRIPSLYFQPQPLKLSRSGDYGFIDGTLKLDLASLKFAYDFSGDFYLGDDTTTNNIVAFRSINPNAPPFTIRRKYVYDSGPQQKPVPLSNFRVFGFNASSTFNSSYYENGLIKIGTVLHTEIPLSNSASPLDLKIHAGYIEVTRDNLDLKHNPNDLISFDLEKWKVQSKTGWYFDKGSDAIILPGAEIFTGLGVDASIKGLNIRPNALREGEILLEGGLSLGGITQLQLAPGLEPRFNYDAGVGHYRISLAGTTSGPVAWVDNLPATSDRLDFSSIGILSDNSTVLSLGNHMLFYNLFDIFVDQIMTGDGFFSLAGMPETGIPGYIPSRAVFTYKKVGNQLIGELEHMNGVVDCNGNVAFVFDQHKISQNLSNKQFTASGTFYIKPFPGSGGEPVTLQGKLTKTPGSCLIDVIPDQTVKMGKEPMKVVNGKIEVAGNQWQTLQFACNTQSTGLDDSNLLSFTVHGGIQANGSDLKVDKINSPLGDLSLTYNFNEKSLTGSLQSAQTLNLGFAGLAPGMMTMRFDPHGYYLGLAGDIIISSDTYSGGFILGAYDSDLSGFTNALLKNFETAKPDFSSLHGFYAIGQRTLLNVTLPLLIIDVSAKAGIGAFVHLDYSDELFQVGGYGFAKLRGGVNITGCGFVGVEQSGYADIVGSYDSGELSISTCQTIETCVGACGLNGCLTAMSRIKLSTSGVEKTFKLGGNCQD